MSTTNSIKTQDYHAFVDEIGARMTLSGSLRLNAAPEYQPISDLMDAALVKAVQTEPAVLALDLTELRFLNSSGINLLYQFVLKVKKQGGVGLRVFGSNSNAWQPKSLSNMVKFMPTLELVMT
jgi:hypothetical protein